MGGKAPRMGGPGLKAARIIAATPYPKNAHLTIPADAKRETARLRSSSRHLANAGIDPNPDQTDFALRGIDGLVYAFNAP
jgi:hypothetical protein